MPESLDPRAAKDQVFDRRGLLARAMNDEEMVRKVIEGFVADFSGQIDDVRTCLESGDGDRLARRLHNMKGVASTVSAEELRGCAAELERLVAAGDMDSMKAGIEMLGQCFARVRRAMLE